MNFDTDHVIALSADDVSDMSFDLASIYDAMYELCHDYEFIMMEHRAGGVTSLLHSCETDVYETKDCDDARVVLKRFRECIDRLGVISDTANKAIRDIQRVSFSISREISTYGQTVVPFADYDKGVK